MKYANINQKKRDRGTSIRAVLVILVLLTSFALPTLRPPVSQAQASGTVVGRGDNNFGQATPPAGLSGVTAIKAGVIYSLALKSDGTVVGWGDNSEGQATPPAGLTGVTAISAGGGFAISSGHSLALKSDGTVVGWGDNSSGQATPPAGLSGVMAISAGGAHSLALKSDGTVVAWGNNDFGQLDIPAGLSGVVAISAGGEHSLALLSAFDLDDLIALVNGLNIHQGIQNSLRAKLNAANAALAANDTATACTKLADFINECNAQSARNSAWSRPTN